MEIKRKGGTVKLRVAEFIADAIIGIQLRICLIMGRWERRYTIKQKKILFILFLCMGVGYCSYVLANALFGQTDGNDALWDHGMPHTPHPVMPPVTVDSMQIHENQ